MVFLGDYINKGLQSASVLSALMGYSRGGDASLLAGNHESSLLDAMDNADLSSFLKMGGAMTIRSYVGDRVGPDVLADFRAAFPPEHLELLRCMPRVYETSEILAQHDPPKRPSAKFQISAHAPVGKTPRIGQRSAQIDTGCGEQWGRLTAFLWPSQTYLQVDSTGSVVRD